MGESLRGIHVRVVVDTSKKTVVVDRDVENFDDAHNAVDEARDEADL